MVLTRELAVLGSRAITGAFQKRIEEVETQAWVSKLALMTTSDQADEQYGFLGDAPAAQEHTGGPRQYETLKPYDFTVRNRRWTIGLNISVDDLRRNKTGQILPRVNEMAARLAQVPTRVLTDLLIANGNAYDGVPFYHASNHVTKSGAVVSNLTTFNASSGTTPTNQEMEAAILQTVERIVSFRDDAGQPRNEFAKQFAVMVPVALWSKANAALKAEYPAAGTSNSIKTSGFQLEIIMNPRLTSDVQMHIFRMDSDVKPLLWQDEVRPFLEPLAEGSEYAKLNLAHLYLGQRVGAGGYGRFDGACRVEFT
jgi:phage major head subunit gpT-like protein